MRIDPAQFWEGLYLYYHENGFISDRVKDDKPRAIKFKNALRLIDDECNLNDFGPLKYKKVEIWRGWGGTFSQILRKEENFPICPRQLKRISHISALTDSRMLRTFSKCSYRYHIITENIANHTMPRLLKYLLRKLLCVFIIDFAKVKISITELKENISLIF